LAAFIQGLNKATWLSAATSSKIKETMGLHKEALELEP
jgi:hypothetical protein